MRTFICTRDCPGPPDHDERSDAPTIVIRQIHVDGRTFRRSKPLLLTPKPTKDGRYYEVQVGEELGMIFVASTLAELQDQILALLETRWKRYVMNGVRLTPAAKVLKNRMVENYSAD